MYEVNKPQGCIVQHRKNSHYFIIKWSIICKNTDSLYCITETNVTL